MEGDPETAQELAKLRIAAQRHLEEIEQETQQEEQDHLKRQEELERYMKRRRSPKPKSEKDQHREEERLPQQQISAEWETKAPSMRTAQDVLDRLRWDQSLHIDEYRVGYLERFDGVKEMRASSWIKEVTEEEWIPQHRIKYFKRIDPRAAGDDGKEGEGEIVWSRDERIDKIFGSTGVGGRCVTAS